MTNEQSFIQNPTANLIDIGNGRSVLVLQDWDVENETSGYRKEEVQTLINMLQESLDIMNRYERVSEKLPLFEGESDVEQQAPTETL